MKQLSYETELCSIKKKTEVDKEKFPVHIGFIKNTSPRINFYATCGRRQGPTSAALALGYLIQTYKPHQIVSVGICAGIEGQVKPKHNVFGTSSVNYEEGKVDTKGNMHLDQFVHQARQELVGKAKQLITDKKRPDYIEGAFSTGSAVRLDQKRLMKELKNNLSRHVKALDMEADAVLSAGEFYHIDALVIKAVADLANGKKNNKNHEECLKKAGIAAFELVKS